jgi:hypothetical protein
LDSQLHVTDNAKALDLKYQLSTTFGVLSAIAQAKAMQMRSAVRGFVPRLLTQAMQYPAVQKANEAVTQAVQTASATFAESRRLYHEQQDEAVKAESVD